MLKPRRVSECVACSDEAVTETTAQADRKKADFILPKPILQSLLGSWPKVHAPLVAGCNYRDELSKLRNAQLVLAHGLTATFPTRNDGPIYETKGGMRVWRFAARASGRRSDAAVSLRRWPRHDA